jgi:hypothetical protein
MYLLLKKDYEYQSCLARTEYTQNIYVMNVVIRQAECCNMTPEKRVAQAV